MLNLFDWVNLGALLVLFGWLHYTAMLMAARELWVEKIALWVTAALCAWQAAAPFYNFAPVAWRSAVLHAAFAALSLVMRKRLIKLLRKAFPRKGGSSHAF